MSMSRVRILVRAPFKWQVAQLVEPVTVNHLVAGSSPALPAIYDYAGIAQW